jgi:TPR repeat protein
MDYQKYLKYKTKYLQQKNFLQKGGDPKEKVAELELKVAAGDFDAASELSEILRYGAPGVQENYERAYQLVKKGKEADNKHCTNLYWTYFLGSKDREWNQEAVSFLLTQVETDKLAKAYLGIYFLERVSESLPDGLRMVTESADLGIAPAMHSLGIYYYNEGRRNIPNIIRGLGLQQKAADMGHLPSMAEYGEILRDEEGCLSDPMTGYQMIKTAAEAGNSRAQQMLAPKRFEPSRDWYGPSL